MTDWDVIECGFNAADETINFGTRNFDALDNLYETSTLASIKCTKEGPRKKPNIKAAIKNGSIFFAVDKTMKVFKDLLCSDLSFNATFDDEIDAFCVTSEGKYLLLGLRNGTVHCFEMEDGAVIYTENIVENGVIDEPFILDMFVESESSMPNFLLILMNGKVYRIASTDASSISHQSESQSFKFTNCLLTDLNDKIQSAAFLNPLLMLTTKEMYAYNVLTKEVDHNSVSDFKQVIAHNRMFLGLDWNGCLINICTKTLLTYSVAIDAVFDNILLIQDEIDTHILGVTKKNELGISYLQLLTYPEYSTIFSLKMSGEIHLITPEHAQDEIIYISELKHGNDVTELRFQVVYETSPENRFKRLLRKQKFDEAEQCAKLFQLDPEEIRKAKAQVIIDKSICYESDIDSLLTVLNTVKDDAFKIQACVNIHSSCNNLKDVERILNFGCLISSKSNEIFLKESQDLILELMFRFNTYMTLVRCRSKNYNVQEWTEFSECDLLKELYIALEHSRIEESIIIYSRMDTTTISQLNEEQVQMVLDVLKNVSMKDQLPFLRTFLPLTLLYIPSSLNLFIRWIVGKVFQIETNYPNQFPENAVIFIKKMAQLLKVDAFKINFQQQRTADQKHLQHLTDLLDTLEQMQDLKDNFKIVVSLRQFLEPKEIVIETLLLDQVIDIANNEHLLEALISKFLQNCQLERDVIFINVIKEITKYLEEYWIKTVPVLLNSIDSVKLKLEATLIVLKAANVPWCTAIHEIANKVLQYSHPLVKEIIREVEYEPKCVILNKNPYQLKKRYINSIDDLKHAINRIVYCNQSSMIEDIYQICKDSKEKHEANVILIIHFINTGEFPKALQILNNNSQEEIVQCCKRLEVSVTFAVDNKYKMNGLQQNCYEMLGPIYQKLQANSAEEFEKLYFQERLVALRNAYLTSKHFNLKITSADLQNCQKKSNIVENLILYTLEDFQVRGDLLGWQQNCDKMSSYLGIDKNIILLQLCERMGDFNVILQAAENMYLTDADAGSLCQIVALILKCLGSSSIPPEDCFNKLSEESFLQNLENVDLSIFIRGLKLAGNMIVTAILKASKDELGYCMELANWIQTTYNITQDDKKHLPAILKNSYGGDIILPSIPSLNAIKNFFLSYRKLIGHVPQPHLNMQYLLHFESDTPKLNEVQLAAEIQSLQLTVASLCTEGHSLMAYKLLKIIQRGILCNSNINSDMNNCLNDIIIRCTKQLLQNVFAARQIDSDLAYSLLLSCDPKYSNIFLFDTLKSYKRDASKFKAVTQLFLRFLKHYKIVEHQQMCINIIYLFKWWNTIKNCQIPYDHFFKKSPADTIVKLIKLNHMNIHSIKQFCLDFKLDENMHYEFYLKTLLLNWKADCIFQTNIFGKKLLIVRNDEEQLLQDCFEVINIIENKESIYDMLTNTWDNINFYHYEVFICVLKLISSLKPNIENNQKRYMLSFLKNYNRVRKPGKTEEEEWYTLYPDTQCIDLLSEWRLPFTPTLFTYKIWNIIRPEINLKTYPKWFEAISVLKKYLNKDDICSFAIKNVIASNVFHQKTSSEWILHARHNDLLKEIDACIQNMSNLEQATSTIYQLTSHIPGGADQVNTITLCYKYALQYQKQSPNAEDVQKAVIKVKNKYFSFSATHILYTYQLADKKYLDMVSGPVDELIDALYMDDRIIKKAACVISYCPDINTAVMELAILHNINLQEKRKLLLNSWLSSNSTTGDFDTKSRLLTADISNHHKFWLDDCDNLLRASYLCTSDDVNEWRNWLLELGDVKPNESKDLNYKANALKCFCNITDIETIEILTDTTYDELRNFINKLMLISCLECFGFSLSIETLDKYSKKDLLNRLAYIIANPICARAMALVCTAYTIYEVKYWSAIIGAMLKQNMIPELKECLIFLKRSVAFHNKKIYIDAWQAVICNSFNLTENMTEEELKCLYISNFYMIQSCPVIFALDLEYVVTKSLQVKKFDFAALAVQYTTREKQTVYLKEILNVDQNIYSKLEEFTMLGFWGVSFVKQLIQDLQQELDPTVMI